MGENEGKRLLCIIASSDGKASYGFSFFRVKWRGGCEGEDGGEDKDVGT